MQVDRDAAELRSLSVDGEELKIIGIVEDSNESYRKTVHHVIRLDAMNSQDLNKVANAYKSIDEITDQLEVLESNHLREALNSTQRRLRYGRIVWTCVWGDCVACGDLRAASVHAHGEDAAGVGGAGEGFATRASTFLRSISDSYALCSLHL